MDAISVLVVARQEEEQRHILEALKKQDDFFIVGVEKDEIEVIIKSERLKPDVVILNLQLTRINLFDVIRIIHRRSPSTAIIILSDKNEDEDNYVSLTLNAGISGFIIKEEDFDKLELIVKLIHMGGKYISASIIDKVFSAISLINQFPGQIMRANTQVFTPTERGIIENLAKGYSDDEVARELNLSKGSMRNCLTAIRHKTKMKTRIEIVVFSLIYGIIRFDNLGLWNKKHDFIFQESLKRQKHRERVKA